MINFREINTINKVSAFIEYREKNLFWCLKVLTFSCTALSVFWLIIDYLICKEIITQFILLRTITIILFLLNFFISNWTGKRNLKVHIYILLYFAVTLFSFPSILTSSQDFVYWINIIFLIAAWHLIIPFPHKELIVHSILFILIFDSILIFSSWSIINLRSFILLNIVFLVTDFLSTMISLGKNEADMNNFLNRKIINEQVSELEASNEKLHEENSKRIASENLLAEQKKYLSSVIEQVPTILWSIDLNGTFLLSEGSGLASLGLKSGEHVGQYAREVYKDIPQMNTFLDRILRGEVEREIVKIRNTYLDTRVGKLFDSEGIQVGYTGISFDITENMNLQAELHKFSLVINQAPGAVIITDINGIIEYVNPFFCKISCCQNGDFLGKHIREIHSSSSAVEKLEDMWGKISSGKTWHGEYQNQCGNEKYWILSMARPYENSDNLLQGYIIIQQDITEQKELQEKLKSEEKKYRDLMEMLPQTIYELDTRGVLKYVNKAGTELFGLTENYLGLSVVNLFIPEDIQRMAESLKKKSEVVTKGVVNEYTAVHSNGKKFPVMIFGDSIVENGQITGTRGIIIDITERKRLEEELRLKEKKYRELTDMLPQTIYELDTTGRLIFTNKAGLKMFGLPENYFGLSAIELFAPEEKQRLIETVKRKAQQPVIGEVNEYVAQHSTGKQFPVLVFGDSVVENNIVVGSRGVVVDISERKAMESALKNSEEQYRTLIQSLQEGLFVIADNKFQFLNSSITDMVGYEIEELIGKSFLTVIAPECQEEVSSIHSKRLLGESVSPSYETVLIHKDGNTRIPIILSVSITSFKGQIAVIGSARNITDRKNWERKLQIVNDKLENANKDLETKVKERTEELLQLNTKFLKIEKENLQSQFEMLKQQVNPHFLFNSLNVLTSLIKLEPDLAEKFTEQLSKVYRYVLENKDKDLVTLETELSFLSAYSFLLDIRFKDKLKVTITIDDKYLEKMVLPLSLQLLIENAIKHNTFSKKQPLLVNVFIDDQNFLNIVNNLQVRESQFASTGVGLVNIKNRYQLLSEKMPEFEKTNEKFIAKIPLL